MESGSQKLLESAVQKTLHAHAFSRSSSQASVVLTDLLSRYLTLLTSTCSKYAQHAGRTGLTVQDIIGALDDLGVSIEELSDYCSSEGKELNRYALHSSRRIEDLHEFEAQLSDGLRQERDDATPLHYARFTTPLSDESDDNEDEEVDDDYGVSMQEGDLNIAETDIPPPSSTPPLGRKRANSGPSTPPLPLSPISNPSSPTRKKSRVSNWEPPSYIPYFLPPFPTTMDPPSSSPDHSHLPHISQPVQPHLSELENVTIEKPPVTIQPMTTSAASDFLVQVPYSQSSLSSVPEWHLPQVSAVPPPRTPQLPTPQTEPSLIAAYHHILTHPPPPAPALSNPLRHKVAMALLSQTQTMPRWDPPDTLYSSVGPCPPRVATIAPTYPVAIGDTPGSDFRGKEGKEKDKDIKFPPAIPRPVSAHERITPLISQQPSRIPDLARHVLPPTIMSRTSRLTHPPVLHRGTKPLIYGSGIPAPWNSNPVPAAGDVAPSVPNISKPKELPNDKDLGQKPPIQDARLYATWDYEPKDFKVPLAPLTRTRSRIGSMQAGSSGVISLGGPRTKQSRS